MKKTSEYFRTLGFDLPADCPVVKIEFLSQVNRFVHRLFRGINRKAGPDQVLPITQHLVETHLILTAGTGYQCGIELEVAALLHDVFEGYCGVSHDKMEAKVRGKLRKLAGRMVEQLELHHEIQVDDDLKASFLEVFVDDVIYLISGVTEAGKSDGLNDWGARKIPYLQTIGAGCSRLASLSCATKASGILTALNYHKAGYGTEHWSAGTHEQNVWFHLELLKIYREKGIPRGLLDYYVSVFNKFLLKGSSKNSNKKAVYSGLEIAA